MHKAKHKLHLVALTLELGSEMLYVNSMGSWNHMKSGNCESVALTVTKRLKARPV